MSNLEEWVDFKIFFSKLLIKVYCSYRKVCTFYMYSLMDFQQVINTLL